VFYRVASRAAGEGSFVLSESAREYHWSGEGQLSIKSFSGGRALYDTGRGRFAVDDGSYLVLNAGQPYTIAIDEPAPVASFCVFFARSLAADAARTATSTASTEARLLDEPAADPAGQSAPFVERTYPHDDVVSPRLARVRAALAAPAPDALLVEERVTALALALVSADANSRQSAASLGALRPSTRDELYRRLHRSRDYLIASAESPVTLADLAGAACLSESHFLRSFRALFGTTPHRYLTDVRLERARRLLAERDLPVTEVCFRVGFESVGSFSALFKRRFGAAPSSVRPRRARDNRDS
jgi:AraC family transcriptional regulator